MQDMTDKDETRVALVGAESSFAIEIIETAERLGLEIAAGILTKAPSWELTTLPAILQRDEVSALLAARPALIGTNASHHRYRIVAAAREMGFTRFPSLVDPSAIVAKNATISPGAFINAGATLGGLAEVREFAIVNRNAALGHHSIMDEYSVIGPGAMVASSCRICRGATLGTGAVLRPDTIIGEGSIVGAGAVVVRDVEPGTVVAGNPARVLKQTSAWADAVKA